MVTTIIFPEEFPVLETERLTLKMAQLEDAASLFQLRSSPDFMKYLGRDPMKEVSEAEDYIQRISDGFKNKTGLSWKICEKGTDQFIGYCGFWEIEYNHYRTEIGYGLNPTFQGRGYMKEALTAMTRFMLLEMNIHHIKADIDTRNIASRQVLLSIGFKKEGLARENFYYNEKFLDSEYYGMIASDL